MREGCTENPSFAPYTVERRKIAVIDAAAAWAEAIQKHGRGPARPFRDNFLTALDDALTAGERRLIGVKATIDGREVVLHPDDVELVYEART